jgi:hypothetical protein
VFVGRAYLRLDVAHARQIVIKEIVALLDPGKEPYEVRL